MRSPLTLLAVVGVLLAAALLSSSASAATVAERVAGHVLLQVQRHGEAWYVDPVYLRRTYLRDGAAAFELMRGKGLGISEADFARLEAGDEDLRARLVGRIMLQVELHGEAWYLCPMDGSLRYMKDGAAAYDIMRSCSLGITDADLATVTIDPSSPLPPGVSPTAPAPSGDIATIGGCQVFPADNPWNARVDELPVHPMSDTFIASIGLTTGLHPDFGENQDYGIPYVVVGEEQPDVPVTWTAYGDESDPGPYPIPADAPIEKGSDAHVLVLDAGDCILYELFNAAKNAVGPGWSADAGAKFDLSSNALRPSGWTSADAAGLPILPGLVRYDEVAAGKILHPIRFTASNTQRGYIPPATHQAGKSNDAYPPMGFRVRLKSDFDISGYDGQARVILEAMKTYGMILADNGSNWYFTGATHPGWDDDDLNRLKGVPGSAFEAVYTGEIVK